MKFLSDILNNYKYNWNNEKYKQNNHIKVLDIKQSSESKIDFYRERIQSKLKKKGFLKHNKKVEKETKALESDFKDYQLSVYLYAFSSFLDTILLESYDSQYLNSITNKITDYSFEYRELYGYSYSQIENESKHTIENQLVRWTSTASDYTGKAVGKIPIAESVKIEEALLKAGDSLKNMSKKKTNSVVQQLLDRQSSYVHTFIDSINDINKLYNKPLELFFDKENIYIGEAQNI